MTTVNRRSFLAAAAGAVALSTLSSRAAEGGGKTLKMGLIGCGGYGMTDVQAALKVGGVEIVAVCDVDSEHLKSAADRIEKLQGKRPVAFKLYQELLELTGLEAVIIATPPHWHALPFIHAMEKGLDVYCEKPLAYDVREAQAMVAAWKKSGRIVQIGFQRRHAAAIAQARDYIQAGNAGRIIQAEAQIHYNAGTKDPTPKDPPPELDWDLWCGPAPKIPYSEQVGHVNWRLEKTTGHGHLVDWGIHLIDAARWILGETMPRTVSAAGGLYYLRDRITTPDTLTAYFDYEKCPVAWRHRIWGAEEYTPEISNGITFFGEKETIFVTDTRWVIIPRFKGAERKVNEIKSDAGAGHMAEFLESVKTRKAPACSPEEGFYSTAAVKLAMVAYDAGAKIAWDAKAQSIVGNDLAAALLKREYRAPWRHPWPM